MCDHHSQSALVRGSRSYSGLPTPWYPSPRDSINNRRLEFSWPLPRSDNYAIMEQTQYRALTKCKVYRAIILSCLLYSSETYTLCRSHIRRLSQMHLRQLRAVLGIRWSDRVINNKVLQRADMPRLEAMLLSRQLTWTGHVAWMNGDRLPKAVLYGELWQAKRNVGRRHLRYMDCTKRHLHTADINKRHWEEMAHDRSAWRTAVEKRAAKAETKRATDAEIKRRRHERALALANRTNQQPQFARRYCAMSYSKLRRPPMLMLLLLLLLNRSSIVF